MAFDWNDTVIAQLRTLWAEGHSTAEIGRRLGVSKNAVVGKARRVGCEERKSPISNAGSWTAENTTDLRDMLLAGNTRPEIAARFGISLDMVDYRCGRLNMRPRNRALPVGGGLRVASEQPRVTPPPLPVRPVVNAPRPVFVAPRRAEPPRPVLYGRVTSCCWPIGDPGTRAFRFCEAETIAGKPYCGSHYVLAYRPARIGAEAA